MAEEQGNQFQVTGLPDGFGDEPDDDDPEGFDDASDGEGGEGTPAAQADGEDGQPATPPVVPAPAGVAPVIPPAAPQPDPQDQVLAQLAESQAQQAALQRQLVDMQAKAETDGSQAETAAEESAAQARMERLSQIEQQMGELEDGDTRGERRLNFERDKIQREMMQADTRGMLRTMQAQAQRAAGAATPTVVGQVQATHQEIHQQFFDLNRVGTEEQAAFYEAAPRLLAESPELAVKPTWHVLHNVLRDVRRRGGVRAPGAASVEGGSRTSSTQTPKGPDLPFSSKEIAKGARMSAMSIGDYTKLLQQEYGGR